MSFAYDYAINRDLCYEEEYPYTAKDGVCSDFECEEKSFELTGYWDIDNKKATKDSCPDL